MLAPLHAGDKIAIVALARKIKLEDIQPAIATFQSWGLEVVLGKTLTAGHHIFAGTDEERAADLQAMLDNPEIKRPGRLWQRPPARAGRLCPVCPAPQMGHRLQRYHRFAVAYSTHGHCLYPRHHAHLIFQTRQ
jgi:hypothetical protein